jgi:L-aminopeptidase/D-esterase-like protein
VVALHRKVRAQTCGGGLLRGKREVESFGNILVAAGFLYGLAASDLTVEELDTHDPLYEVVVGLRATKRP